MPGFIGEVHDMIISNYINKEGNRINM